MKTFAAKTVLFSTLLCVSLGALPRAAWAQTSSAVAPTLIPVSGKLMTADGLARTGQVQLVISLYDLQGDTAPRWIEQQTVTLDASGGYSVQFGATLPDGLPGDLFTAGTGTRWLGVAVQGEGEQQRVMLLSVPYAAKAGSAETLGGRSASDFVLSSTFREDLRTVLEEEGVATASDEISVQATANSLQKSDGATLVDSTVFEVNGNVGIGTSNPTNRLHLVGTSTPDFLFARTQWGQLGRIYAATDGSGWADGRLTVQSIGGSGNFVDTISVKNGRVGLGANSPQAKLHIEDATSPDLLFRRAGWGQLARFYAATDGNSWTDARVTLQTVGAGGAYFDTFSLKNGNVGIGTTSPTTRLHVVGNASVSGDLVAGGVLGAKYQDVAEWVETREALEPGTVVVVDPKRVNGVIASTRAYDSGVAGAVSPQPGLILGEKGPNKAMIAQSGRVRIKADAQYGAIKPGDLVVTSPRAGYAMRAKSSKVKPGTVLGKALEGLSTGDGEILVLITLQ